MKQTSSGAAAHGALFLAELQRHKEPVRLAALRAATGLTDRQGDAALRWLKRQGLVRLCAQGWSTTEEGTKA